MCFCINRGRILLEGSSNWGDIWANLESTDIVTSKGTTIHIILYLKTVLLIPTEKIFMLDSLASKGGGGGTNQKC